jgi:hypothetical protein
MFVFNIAVILGSLSLEENPPGVGDESPGLVWFTSNLQTLPDHGDNPRFSVPIQTLVLFVVLWWGFSLLNRKKHENSQA